LIKGPTTLYPRKELKVLKNVSDIIIPKGQALKLVALQDLVDSEKNNRVAGESWLITKEGAYLPGPYEEVEGLQ